MSNLLERVKSQKWFYEFRLPDGSTTESYLAASVRDIHRTRERALRALLESRSDIRGSALDVACHEGYYSLILAEYFECVRGIDKNHDSLAKARLIGELLGSSRATFRSATLEELGDAESADFVLCYGLLYHVENPLAVMRRLAALARRALCIETQVLPFDMRAAVEDGTSVAQRDLQGLFGICFDYSSSKEGGLTDIALVPSRNALEFMLRQLGFGRIEFFHPAGDDYEQFVRGHRVIVIAER